MIVRMLKTVRGGQEVMGTVSYVDGEFRVSGSLNARSITRSLFGGDVVPDDPSIILDALRAMPERYDGIYARAEIVQAEGGPGSGWFAPPKGTHGPGSQGGTVASKKQPALPGMKPEWVKKGEPEPEEPGPPPKGGEMDLWYDWSDPGWNAQREEWYQEATEWEEYGIENGIDRAFDREWIAKGACEEDSSPLYAMYDGHELVALAAVDAYVEDGDYFGGDPDKQYKYIHYLASKRGGYGEELLTYAREIAAEDGYGVYLTSLPEAEGFYRYMGGTHVGGGKYYWDPLYEEAMKKKRTWGPTEVDALAWSDKDGSGKKWKGKGKPPFREGGPGSGWFAPPKGTHGKGSQGGKVGPGERSTFAQTVSSGAVVATSDVSAGITDPDHLVYENGIEARFKEHGARGTKHDAFSEVAAYELSRLLGPDKVVPEVVYGEFEGREGTIGKFIPGTSGMEMDGRQKRRWVNDQDNLSRLEVMVALDTIMHNHDRHEGNWIIDDEGQIWAIDHGHATWESMEWDRDIGLYRHPVWWQTSDVPSASNYNRHGEYVATFRVRDWTLDRWRQITYEDFERALQPQIDASADLSSRRSFTYSRTRVNVDIAWNNFQKLLDIGEIQQSY
jgi:hypothetical protein